MRVKTPLLGVKVTGGLEGVMTARAGVSPLIMLGRKCGLVEIGDRVLPSKRSEKRLRSWQMMESFVLMSALGGECYEDMEHLRSDAGLVVMLGYTPPSAETARQWLDRFHDEGLMAGRPVQGSFLPAESEYLAGLEEVKRQVLWDYIKTAVPATWMIPESQWGASGIGRPGAEGKPIPWVTLDIYQVVRHAGQILLRITEQAWNTLIEPAQRIIAAMLLDTSAWRPLLLPTPRARQKIGGAVLDTG